MKMARQGLAAWCLVMVVLGPVLVAAQAQPRPTPPPVEPGFERFEGAPPSEQIPAGRLVVAAYAFIWVAILLYGWSLWRRLGRVERDLAELGRRLDRPPERVHR